MKRPTKLQKMRKMRRAQMKKKTFKKQSKPEQHELEMEESTGMDSEQIDYEDEYEDIYEDEKYIDTSKQNPDEVEYNPFMGTRNDLPQGQYLEFSNRGYMAFHRAHTEWPCLSVDFLMPGINTISDVKNIKMLEKFDYPLDLYVVSGSQAEFSGQNKLYVMRFADLAKTRFDDDEEEAAFELEGAEDKEKKQDAEPVLFSERIQLYSAVNRVRSLGGSPLVAVMNQTGQCQLYDVSNNIKNLEARSVVKSQRIRDAESSNILGNFQLSDEGFGLDWSPTDLGRFATGTNNGILSLFRPTDESFSKFIMEESPLKAHNKSIEDIQFSPLQGHVLATCSSDNSIKIFDLRDPTKRLNSAILIKAHQSDVNVMSWNSRNSNLLASGDDDGFFKVFDLRFPQRDPLTEIGFHQDSICSIAWQPHDEWTLAVAGLDDRISIWDLSVETDAPSLPGQEMSIDPRDEIPDQLLFLHQGQQELREMQWHPAYKDVMVSTAIDSFNVFQPAFDQIQDLEEEEDDISRGLTDSPNDMLLN